MMRFCYILHKNSIGHLLKTSWDCFGRQSFSIFNAPAKCWREGCSEGCFCPPPPFTQRNDRCNLRCSFYNLGYKTMYSSFENTTYKDH